MSSFVVAVAGLAAGLLTFAITWPLARILAGLGLVDRPNHRSMHTGDIPRGGGAGLTIAVTVVVLACIPLGLDARVLLVLVLALSLAGVGFVDDRHNLNFSPRLLAQLLIALAAVAITRDPDLSTVTHWPLIPTALLATVWMLGCCNAVNFMDGVNAITGLHVIVFGTHLAIVGRDDDLVRVPSLVLAGAAFGFLYWNTFRRRVFLGDGGAYFIGTSLGLLVVLASIRASTPLVAAAPFAVYAADTSIAFGRRLVSHDNVTRGHRDHVYQRLTIAGRPQVHVALFTATCSAACSVTAVAVADDVMPPGAGAALAALAVAAYLSAPRWWRTSTSLAAPTVPASLD